MRPKKSVRPVSIRLQVLNHILTSGETEFTARSFHKVDATNRTIAVALRELCNSGHIHLYTKQKLGIGGIIGHYRKGAKQEEFSAILSAPLDKNTAIGWRKCFPEMFNPIELEGNKTVHKLSMV